MQDNPLRTFVDLVNFDQSLRAKAHEIAKLEQEINALKQQKEAAEQELVTVKSELHSLKKEVDHKDREVKEMDQKEHQLKKKLDAVTSQKEYLSLTHEIETLNTSRSHAEDVLLEMWNQLTVKQEKVEQIALRTKKNTEALDNQLAQKQHHLMELQGVYDQHLHERPAKERNVRPEWLEQYQRMLASVANPVVPLVHQSCGGCFFTISNQDLAELDKRKLVACKNCYRLLYSEEKL